MSETIRVAVVDDHLIVREGLRLILETVDDIILVGEAGDGLEGLKLVSQAAVDVVLMDMRMPGMDGLTAIEHLRADHPDVAIVILTTYNEDQLMVEGMQAGANAFLLKDTDRTTLFDTIRAAAAGQTLLQPEVMARLMDHVDRPPRTPTGSTTGPTLTERELQVLVAVARGDRNKEIALALNISERTVKAHLTSIYNKLGVDSRAAAVSQANQQNII